MLSSRCVRDRYYHEWSVPPQSETLSLQVVEMNQLLEQGCHFLNDWKLNGNILFCFSSEQLVM